VGGWIADLVMSIFLLPTLYVWIAGDRDVLPAADGKFEEGERISIKCHPHFAEVIRVSHMVQIKGPDVMRFYLTRQQYRE
jgi:hypothetical protein